MKSNREKSAWNFFFPHDKPHDHRVEIEPSKQDSHKVKLTFENFYRKAPHWRIYLFILSLTAQPICLLDCYSVEDKMKAVTGI